MWTKTNEQLTKQTNLPNYKQISFQLLTTNQMKPISSEELNKLSPEKRKEHLSITEKKYFDMMKSSSKAGGTLYITSRPGLAKSSIARNVARVMGYQYLDVRLSIADETDFGMPKLKSIEYNGVMVDVHTMTTPEWAVEANKMPTIIHFEELNRCSLNVRNACLGVLNERTIGSNFKFNEDVLMLASGNLGEDDGTDVEEFDGALNNRLFHMKHDLLAEDWIEQFAKYYVHPLIVGFIKNQPEYLYRKDGSDNGEQPKAFATPRSWTYLSNYLLYMFGEEEQLEGNFDVTAVRTAASEVGHAFVGTAISKFTKYLDESMKLTVMDILNNYTKVAPRLAQVNRDKKSELLNQIQEMDMKKFKVNQIKNLVEFLRIIDEDERAGFLTFIIDKKSNDEKEEPYRTILLSFTDLLTRISTLS